MPHLRRSEQDQAADDRHGADYLETLARGLRILTAFTAERRQMTLSEVASSAELPRASARRALFTLERLGYVRTDERLFSLTPNVLKLATAYLSSNGVSAVAQPIVDAVSRDLGETCSVAIRDGHDIVFVARATPRRIVSIDLAVGYRLPALATAVGRVLLGALTDAELDAFLRESAPQRLTARTIIDKAKLRGAVIEARRQGYCVADEEAELGLRSVAVPVSRYDGLPVAAIHVGVRSEQVSLERLRDEILHRLTLAAAEIGRMLIG